MRAALTFSLWLISVAIAFAGSYGDLAKRVAATDEPIQAIRLVKHDPLTAHDAEVQEILNGGYGEESVADQLEALVQLRALMEGESVPSSGKTTQAVKQIKSSPVYRDPGITETSNWLARALERLKNIRFKPPEMNNGDGPSLGIGPWLSVAMWGVIAAVAGFLIYLAVKHIRWQRKVARKASALLEEDEPERSLDEWLLEADNLESQGRYREAVRALYLACLLRFDEAGVARFHRGETNWEHLARIEVSPKLPPGTDFRSPTKLFDRVWYGKMVRGKEDADLFRRWYVDLTDSFQRRAAA